MLIDTHCHLDAAEFVVDRDAVYAAALAAGVERLVVPAVAVDGFEAVKNCVQRYPACVAAYGIHPLHAMAAGDDDLACLRRCLQTEDAVAVGEIGLDYYVPGIDPERQARLFVEQLKLAREFDLPVILHVRRAVDQVLKYLRRSGVRCGIAHAFNGSRQQADEFVKLGFKLGFGGALTYAGSTRIRALAAELPLTTIVLETDAPDMPPAWLARGRNAPAELPRIAAELATLRGLPPAEVIRQTGLNAAAVFR